MGSDWETVSLGNHCLKIGSGATPRGGSSVYLDEGEVSLIRSQNIYNDGFKKNGLVYITEEAAIKLKNVIVEDNDILLNITGDSVARLCLVDSDFLPARVNQHVAIIRPAVDSFDPRYLRYQLVSPAMQSLLLTLSSAGATRNALTKNMIETLDVSKPPLEIQKAISYTLGSLDDKIELNRQMNETLEAMSQALFKSWFVDFDPVIDNALVAGNAIPDAFAERAEQRKQIQKTSEAEATNQLFPDAFEFTEEMGWIPLGWRVTELSNLITIKHGFAFKGEFFSQEETQDILLTPGNFNIGGGFKANKFKYYKGPVPEDYILIKNDLLVTMTDLSKIGDTLGYPIFVPESQNKRYLHNQRLGKVEIIEGVIGKEFLYRCLCSKSYRDHVLSNVSGSTVKHTSPTKIMTHEVCFSGGKAEEAFEKLSQEFSRKSQNNDSNSQSLSKLRDTLLPKLLSGELLIPDAEKLVEEA